MIVSFSPSILVNEWSLFIIIPLVSWCWLKYCLRDGHIVTHLLQLPMGGKDLREMTNHMAILHQVVMSIWGFCRCRYKLNQTLFCIHYNTWSVAILCSKTSCCEHKLYLQDRVLFKYHETLQKWMLVLCKENTLSCVQCQKLSISFRFLNLLKILITDGTAEGL